MARSTSSPPIRPRLNPFAFPSDTDFRFALIVVTLISVSLYNFRWLYSRFSEDFVANARVCLDLSQLSTAGDLLALLEASAFQSQCMRLIYGDLLMWLLIGLGVELVVGIAIYMALPAWKIRREQLIPLLATDAPEVLREIEALEDQIGLSKRPVILWNPLNASTGGLAFGRLGRYYVSLMGGLVTRYYTDLPAFRSTVLHELAHLKNGDVDKTYLTIALWRAFVIASLVPLALSQLVRYPLDLISNLGIILNLGLRAIFLAVMVFVIRNAVLRAREYYADLRVSVWEGAGGPLTRILEVGSGEVRGWRSRLFSMHPTNEQRVSVLADPLPLFRMGFPEAFAAGIVAGIAYPSLEIFFSFLLTSTLRTNLAPLLTSVVIAPVIVGIIVLGLWRIDFSALHRGGGNPLLARLALGLWLGISIGRWLSFESFIDAEIRQPDLISLLASYLFNALWAGLLLLFLSLYLLWVRSGARQWLRVASRWPSPRWFYLSGLAAAGAVMLLWFPPLFWISKYYAGPEEISLAILVGLLALPTLYLKQLFTLVAFALVWMFPLAAYRWRERSAVPPAGGWEYLEPTAASKPGDYDDWPQPRPNAVAAVAAITGAVYLAVLLAGRVIIQAAVPVEIRGTDQGLLLIYYGWILVALLFQMALAAGVALWTRKLNVSYALFAAFVSGLVMASGFLAVNVLLGGTIVPTFAWGVLTDIVNGGFLLALPAALVAALIKSTLTKRRPEVHPTG